MEASAASASSQIPVVDFSAISLENEDPLTLSKQAVTIVAEQLYRAFSTIGFVYLQNHGISQKMVRYKLTNQVSSFSFSLFICHKKNKREEKK